MNGDSKIEMIKVAVTISNENDFGQFKCDESGTGKRFKSVVIISILFLQL
jgi:hypothetical protein